MLQKIVSGGQTGVDRGALDAALASGFPCGGWCPAGRRAEDGRIPDRYPVTELDSPRYLRRTRKNVEDSDGTLVLAHGAPTGGTRATVAHARRVGRPCLVLDLDGAGREEAVAAARAWIAGHGIGTLNVAGPRGSSAPDIQADAFAIISGVISPSPPS